MSQAKSGLSTKKSGGVIRYYHSVGLGFRTPKEAIEGTYVDKKCPFTSNVSIRGRILKGTTHETRRARHDGSNATATTATNASDRRPADSR